MTEATKPTVQVPSMCNTHRVLLVRQVGYGPKDPWQALEVMAGVALFQAVTADPKIAAELGGDIEGVARLGCLACRKPDAFGEIVAAAQTRKVGAIRELGERWVKAAAP